MPPASPKINSRDKAKEIIKNFEDYSEKPYPDAGKFSIGYGHRLSDEELDSVKNGITKEQAEQFLEKDLSQAHEIVSKLVTVPISESKKAALTSFVYNVGRSKFAGSTLLKQVNKGKHDAAISELRKWVYSGNKKLSGLVNRRKEETTLYADNESPVAKSSLKTLLPEVSNNSPMKINYK